MSETLTRCKCSKCGEIGELETKDSTHAPLALKGKPECGGTWQAAKEERQPCWGNVNVATCMLRDKETGVKREEIGLAIEDRELKQTVLLTKANAIDLEKHLRKVLRKLV